jgi:hypothetical protein
MKILRCIIILSLVLSAYADIPVCSDEAIMSSCADTKFISRMVGKQQALTQMKDDLKNLIGNREKKNDILTASDMRYLSRMENKLGALVVDTLQSMETTKNPTFSPMVAHNLLPENKIKKDKN